MMDKSCQKKRKSGAEKERERKKIKLSASASECRKISDIFKTDTKSPSRQDELEAGPSTSLSTVACEVKHVMPTTSEISSVSMNQCGGVSLTEANSSDTTFPSSPTLSVQRENSQASVSGERSPFICYFTKPHGDDRRLKFWRYHPHQKTNNAVVKRSFVRKDGSNRTWLSYNEENHSLHCSVCIAFSNSSDYSTFIKGMTDWRHVHLRIEEHEHTKIHLICSAAYIVERKQSSISHLTCSQREEMKRKREVMERVVDVVRLIGKRGLSYRGTKEEAAYTFDDEADHGTLIEVIKLLGKYDNRTAQHLTDVVQNSKKRHSEAKGSRGRGFLVTFLSKTTVNSVIRIIGEKMRQWISSDIKDMFAVELDTTQDISTQDQCSVIVRYVDSSANIKERLVAVLKCTESTGIAFVQLLSEVMTTMKLNLQNCVGNSTDGAANMQGKYNGFSTLLTKEAPNQVHIWCHAHVLNLVLTEATSVVVASVTLFSLLNDVAVFFRESYQQMNIWSMHSALKRLGTIGETRWWSKDASLRKMFGSFKNPTEALYVDVLKALNNILANGKIQAAVRAKANGYIQDLLKFETVVTAQVFLRLFSFTTPLSKYLQTTQLDLLTVHRMVEDLWRNMSILRKDFQECHVAAKQFVEWANNELEETEEELILEESFPIRRQRQKKQMAGEKCQDEAASTNNPTRKYEIDIYNPILDSVIRSIDQRLLQDRSSAFYADLSLLHPRNFCKLPSCTGMMAELSKRLKHFDVNATAEQLQEELQCFARQWPTLKQSASDVFSSSSEQNEECESDQEATTPYTPISASTVPCKDCPLCCYKLLHELKLFTDTYKNIGLAYKFMLTLPVSQVGCERSFSTLKRIKTRLRSNMTQDHLEAFMLMSVEKGVLAKIENESIIDAVADSSKELHKLLSRSNI